MKRPAEELSTTSDSGAFRKSKGRRSLAVKRIPCRSCRDREFLSMIGRQRDNGLPRQLIEQSPNWSST